MKNMAKYMFVVFCGVFLMVACEKIADQELILYDFETEAVLDEVHWKCHTLFSLSEKYAVHGKYSLRLELFPSSYPGLSPALKYNDWSGYQALYFEVYNPSPDSLKLILRIDDKKEALEYTDRYNKGFLINPGANTLNIPLDSLTTSETNRPLALKNIYRFLVFMSHIDRNHVLYLDYFRLIPRNDLDLGT